MLLPIRWLIRFLEWVGRADSAGDSIKVVLVMILPNAFIAFWVEAEMWQKFVVFDAGLIATIVIVYYSLLLLHRFGSTAEVRFVLEPWMEAKLYVTNAGPKAEFFASVWFEGAGTGGRPTLFAHWGDGAGHRVPLVRGQTGVITLGRMEHETGSIRRWSLFAMTNHDTLEHVKPIECYAVGTQPRDGAHASMLVQIFAEPELERRVPDTRIVFADNVARAI